MYLPVDIVYGIRGPVIQLLFMVVPKDPAVSLNKLRRVWAGEMPRLVGRKRDGRDTFACDTSEQCWPSAHTGSYFYLAVQCQPNVTCTVQPA